MDMPAISVITSCIPKPEEHGHWHGHRVIPPDNRAVIRQLKKWVVRDFDIFCFLGGDTEVEDEESGEVLLPEAQGLNLVKALADMSGDDAVLETIAQRYRRFLEGCNVWAAASNLPGISSTDEKVRRSASRALCTVCSVAARLGAGCVEIVAGSDFTRDVLPKGKRKDRTRRYVWFGPVPRGKRFRALIDSLGEVTHYLTTNHLEIGLAFELEPGPSFLLNSFRRAEFLMDMVATELGEEVAERVGINLDIGHALRLARMEDDAFHRAQRLRRKIMHAHISRHRAIHGPDLPLRKEQDRDACVPWLCLYSQCCANRWNPHITGAVALEQEYAFMKSSLNASIQAVNAWLKEASC